jgi:TatD DNase family protein
MMELFDSHAHYDDEKFDPDRDSVIETLKGAGIAGVMNAASDLNSSRTSFELTKKYDFFWSSAGIHPHEASTLDDGALLEIERLCGEEKVVAIGEIGLDYHYDYSPREVQRLAFERQLSLAEELGMPVVIHSREAAQDTLEIIKRHSLKGVIHCFSYPREMAEIFLKLGFYIGFTVAVTFQNAESRWRPRGKRLGAKLIETDCPTWPRIPFRGKRCDSTMLKYLCCPVGRPWGFRRRSWQKKRKKRADVYGIGF